MGDYVRKINTFIIVVFITLITVYFSFGYKNNNNPSTLYKVYLNGEVLGVIESKSKLENYIYKQNKEYKYKYGVNKVYAPNGLEIRKISTYNTKVDSVKKVYEKIKEKSHFTILGYQFNIKSDDKVKTVYVTDDKIFKKAMEATVKTFVGEEEYNAYKNEEQNSITTTGSIIENVYINENITIKKINIPVTETIYTDETELSKYLLFGETGNQSKYIVQIGDTIEQVAFNNKISVEEFLISNPEFTSSKNLLFPGQEVIIGVTDPQVSVVVEKYSIEDKEISYQTEYQYDEERIVSDEEVIQKGENGLERVSQRIKIVNGVINYVDVKSREELKPTISEIVIKGKKNISGVGSTRNWLWPTNNVYTISSDYVYRINPITGARELHQAIDISGTGYGANIYAVTNGVVSESTYRTQDGNYVCINHNNGYYTCYAHMAKRNVKEGQIVERGQVIGFVGQSGYATGPHLHFEIWIGKPWNGGYRINPWSMYR